MALHSSWSCQKQYSQNNTDQGNKEHPRPIPQVHVDSTHDAILSWSSDYTE